MARVTVEDCVEKVPNRFGLVLLAMPDPRHPALSSVLPKMADEQVQRDWTGNAGVPLLAQSLNFVRSVALKYREATGAALQEASILDFGCGYGRLLRLMTFYAPPSRIWGVDPWNRSLEICQADRMPMHLALSDYLPRSLPVGEARFELIYAFSVFTHLSRRTTLMALATLRHATLSAGVLGVLAEALGDGPPVFASLHPVLDISAWRFRDVPGDAGAAVADLAGLGYVLVGKRSLMPLPGQAEVRLGQTGSRPRAIQENLGALMDEAAGEARRWGGLPAGAALVVAGLGGMMPVQAGPVQAGPMQGEGEQPARKYSAAVAGVGRISAILS